MGVRRLLCWLFGHRIAWWGHEDVECFVPAGQPRIVRVFFGWCWRCDKPQPRIETTPIGYDPTRRDQHG